MVTLLWWRNNIKHRPGKKISNYVILERLSVSVTDGRQKGSTKVASLVEKIGFCRT